MMRRYAFLTSALASTVIFSMPETTFSAPNPAGRIGKLERSTGGRLGIFALDTLSGLTMTHRAHERFPMCSTFKFLAASAILSRVDHGKEHLDRRITYTKNDLLAYAPVTTKNLANGSMTVGELCAAAVDYSDNTAANLLLAALGGPAAVTAFARSLGDGVTRLDRKEPALNTAIPGDVRDTTTPDATAYVMRKLLLGNVLSESSRNRLNAWLLANRTGDDRIRAGVPKSWRVGDKTGSGDGGTRNDIAVLWPPHRAPIILTVYLTGSKVSAGAGDAAIASVARLVSVCFA